MANAVLHLSIIAGDEAAPTINDRFTKPSDQADAGLQAVATYLEGAAGGAYSAKAVAHVENGSTSGSFAAATVVITHANVAINDTLTIAGNVFTWVAAAANENQITIGASATADGDALVAALAAHSVVSNFVTGVNVTGTVTITSRVPGYLGKAMLMATSKPTAFALTQPVLTSPTVGMTLRSWSKGLA